MTDEELKRVRRPSAVRRLRCRLGLSQRGFARRFGIALGTLRDWEQGRFRPNARDLLCLRLIARYPEEAAEEAREIARAARGRRAI